MSVYTVIECDKCGEQDWYVYTGKTHIIRWSREDGWSIGKQILCPSCRNAQRRIKKQEEDK